MSATPSHTETVVVRDADQAMAILDTWRRGDVHLATRARRKAELRRLFAATGTLRVRAWETTWEPLANGQEWMRGRRLVELVIRQRGAGQADGQPVQAVR